MFFCNSTKTHRRKRLPLGISSLKYSTDLGPFNGVSNVIIYNDYPTSKIYIQKQTINAEYEFIVGQTVHPKLSRRVCCLKEKTR